MIYLDSAATSLHRPKEVAEAVCSAMGCMGNSGRGAHEAAFETSRIIFSARKEIGEFFGMNNPAQVIFTSNATQSLNMAIGGLFFAGDHVITTCLEHNSVLRPLYRLQEKGMELTILPCDEKGDLCCEELEGALRPNTKGVVCTQASNLTGNLVDFGRIGQFCKDHGLLFIADCAQTAGVYPVHMDEYHIDVLCFTGHKGLLGPQGTGGMCIREGVLPESFCVGGSGVQSFSKRQPEQMPERLEAGTLNGHGIAGLLAGVRWLKQMGLKNIKEKELFLMRRFYEGVREIPGVVIYGNLKQEERTAVVCLNIFDEREAAIVPSGEIGELLAGEYDIAVRSGAHCAPLMHEALGTKETGAVRFSFSFFNTEEEVERAVCAVREIAEEYR
ncbi:MAG: aminotransferase class V-fold PLP-dependent enzyme [Clostridiales bacterium]|nr:aminotransferase class V-fold PLP-dependent enzyme [Clostridiales bacterium]